MIEPPAKWGYKGSTAARKGQKRLFRCFPTTILVKNRKQTVSGDVRHPKHIHVEPTRRNSPAEVTTGDTGVHSGEKGPETACLLFSDQNTSQKQLTNGFRGVRGIQYINVDPNTERQPGRGHHRGPRGHQRPERPKKPFWVFFDHFSNRIQRINGVYAYNRPKDTFRCV